MSASLRQLQIFRAVARDLSYTRAAEALPEGAWRLEGAPVGYDLTHAALGWLFAQYRFTRYKPAEAPRARLVCPAAVDAAQVLAMAAGE